MATVLCGLYSGAIVMALGWPLTGWGVAVLALAQFFRKGKAHLTTLGSARWADESDLRREGMLGATSGLILGRMPARRRVFNPGIAKPFALRIGAKEACREFFTLRRKGELVRLPKAVHSAIFIPTGGGKGVSFAVPFLKTCSEPCVVVDFKGDLARLTAEHRRREFGHRVVLLDPYRIVTKSPDTLNVVDGIDKDSPLAIDECNDLAKALVVRPPDAKEPHWDDNAEAVIAALIAEIVAYGERDGTRSMQMVREMSGQRKLDLAIKLMRESDCLGGMLRRMGDQLLHLIDREKSSTLTTVSRHLRFLDTLAVAESTKTSSFNPADLLKGKMTVYLILPPEHMRAQAALLRMWIFTLLRAVVRGGLQERNKVHFILDEAASLGRMEALDDAIDKYRGYGVRLQLYYQSLGQVKTNFPEGRDQTLLSNTNQIFAGVNDYITAENVSNRLGEGTIIVDSGGSSSGGSYQSTQSGQPSSSRSTSENVSSNWAQQARRLLKPDEVMTLSPRTAITFVPGVRPICTTLLRYFEEPSLGRRSGWLARTAAACGTLAASAALCAVSMSIAAVLTIAVDGGHSAPNPAPAEPSYDVNIFGDR